MKINPSCTTHGLYDGRTHLSQVPPLLTSLLKGCCGHRTNHQSCPAQHVSGNELSATSSSFCGRSPARQTAASGRTSHPRPSLIPEQPRQTPSSPRSKKKGKGKGKLSRRQNSNPALTLSAKSRLCFSDPMITASCGFLEQLPAKGM